MGRLGRFIRELTADQPELELDDIQATVLRERPEPYFGTHVLLRFDTRDGGREFLRLIRPHLRSAGQWWEGEVPWISLSLSYSGLEAIGIPQESLDSFPESFRAGMAGRSDKLLGVGPNDPKWWERAFKPGNVHAAVSVFAPTEQSHQDVLTEAESTFSSLDGVTAVLRQDFGAQVDARNSLGFKDMVSNPAVAGSGVKPLPGQGPPIAAGEFVLGYPGESGEPLEMPQPDVLGRNGTYAVVRKYHTNAGSFNRFLRDNSDSDDDKELLAAKMVGRWRSGAPLDLTSTKDDPELGADRERNNDFTYSDDPDGLKTPRGSHARRMNPREGGTEVVTDTKVHRIMRRATAYGPPYDPDATSHLEDLVDRGLYFFLMSAKAMSTMEFLQQEWVNKGQFADLGQERDPVIGIQDKDVTFTVPKQPVRKRYSGLHTYNVLRGGEYMFMPGLKALDWIIESR